MNSYINIIGDDAWNIILYYKNEFERIEHNHRTIDNCIFEEFDKSILDDIINDEYNENVQQRYYFKNISIREFREYYLNQGYILSTTFKFMIEEEASDNFDMHLDCIHSQYLSNLKISYIYKLNDFKLCIYLGNFNENDLTILYKEIAKNYITAYTSH